MLRWLGWGLLLGVLVVAGCGDKEPVRSTEPLPPGRVPQMPNKK